MRNSIETLNKSLFEVRDNSDALSPEDQQKSLNFNAAVSLFILFSLFSLFFMVPVTALISFGMDVNLLPFAVAIMLSAAVIITLLFLSHAIDMVNVLINK